MLFTLGKIKFFKYDGINKKLNYYLTKNIIRCDFKNNQNIVMIGSIKSIDLNLKIYELEKEYDVTVEFITYEGNLEEFPHLKVYKNQKFDIILGKNIVGEYFIDEFEII